MASNPSTAWLFPGQGTQFVGMGRDLYERSPAAREVFERANDALGEKLSDLLFHGPEAELTLTKNAQPAIVTTSLAALAMFRELVPSLPTPHFAAGHSLGEYSALVAAGALALEDAVRLVRARGEAMQNAVPQGLGAMSAVMGLERDVLERLCAEEARGDVLSCANFNAPGQIVVAGHATAVERLATRVAEHKGKSIALKVSAPFHCALMRPAARVVGDRLERVPISAFAFPVVANVDARPNHSPERVKELLVGQVDGPVLWTQVVSFMHAEGVSRAFEIGPGKVLAGLAKRIAKELVVTSLGDAQAIETFAAQRS